MDDQVGVPVIRRLREVDQGQFIAPVIIYQPRRGVNAQRRAADDEHLRAADVLQRALHHPLVQRLFIQHDIRPHDAAAAVAARHAQAVVHGLRRVGRMAARAVSAQDAPVQLEHVFAPRRLVQPVDVLRDQGAQLAFALQLRQAQVRPVGLRAVHHQLRVVEAVILLRVAVKERPREDGLRRIVPLLVVEPVHAAEIRYAALGGHAGPAEKDDVVALRDPLAELFDFCVHLPRLREKIRSNARAGPGRAPQRPPGPADMFIRGSAWCSSALPW